MDSVKKDKARRWYLEAQLVDLEALIADNGPGTKLWIGSVPNLQDPDHELSFVVETVLPVKKLAPHTYRHLLQLRNWISDELEQVP